MAEDLGGSGAILGKPYFSEELAEIDRYRNSGENALPLSSRELRQIYEMYLCAQAYQDLHKTSAFPKLKII